MNIARLIVPAIRWHAERGFAGAESLVAEALALGVGGFIVFGGTTSAVRDLTESLRARAGRPLLIAADLERGAGQQVEGLTSFPPPLALSALNDLGAIRQAADLTAREALSVGINWVLAPVADLDVDADNPIVQTRAFGSDGRVVGRAVRAWIVGCQTAGALACAKHYPGHGRTREDSHATLPIVAAPRDVLEAQDEIPFRAAVWQGVASVMTAHVRYPALDPAPVPATFSAPIIQHLRKTCGFNGLIVTDALIMEGALAGQGEAAGAVSALGAGCDILLYPNDTRAVLEAVDRAVTDGRLARRELEASIARYEKALSLVAGAEGTLEPYDPALASAVADDIALRVLARGGGRDRPSDWQAEGRLQVEIIDDDQGGPYPPGPNDVVPARLREAGVELGAGARVVLVFAEPRAWKGRAGFGAESVAALDRLAHHASLVVLFGHPRLVDSIPGQGPVLVAWHRQCLMQEAVARWIGARM